MEANVENHSCNVENHDCNVLEPLLDMLRKVEKLKVPNPDVWLDVDDHSYEIDFYRDQLVINYDFNGDHIFDLNSLPSSQEIQKAIATCRRVELDWGEIEEARSSFYMARRILNKACQEIEKFKSSHDKALRSLDNVYKALERQDIFSTYREQFGSCRYPIKRGNTFSSDL